MMIWNEDTFGRIVVTVPDQAALLADLDARLASGQGFCVATLNLDHVVKLSRDAAFRAAYRAQTHVTADGNPIVWLSRLAGQRVSLVAGSELISPIAALAAENHVAVALFGATQTTLDAAAAALKRHYPALEISLCHAPAMGFDPKGEAALTGIEHIAASGARLCFLALGAPKQEIFAALAQVALPKVGFVSIGAGLDFIAGSQKRAPVWVRCLSVEWLWRLCGNPRRLLGRYAACMVMLPKLTAQALRRRLQAGTLP